MSTIKKHLIEEFAKLREQLAEAKAENARLADDNRAWRTQEAHLLSKVGEVQEKMDRALSRKGILDLRNQLEATKRELLDAQGKALILKDENARLEQEAIRRITHLNRLGTWASQDPTGPLPHWMGSAVQSWVLEELRAALGGAYNPTSWQPQVLGCPADDIPMDSKAEAKLLHEQRQSLRAENARLAAQWAVAEAKCKEACGECVPSGGYDYFDEVCGLLRVTRGQRDQALEELARLRAAMGEK